MSNQPTLFMLSFEDHFDRHNWFTWHDTIWSAAGMQVKDERKSPVKRVGGLRLTAGLLDAGPLGRALSAVLQGRASDSLLDKWATLGHKAFSEYTNPQSIESKSKVHGMTKWLQKATPEAKERDRAVFHLMADKSIHEALLSTCDTALAVDWMAEYESKETLTARRAMRPSYSEA
ncbi:hypothetical protein BU17DRAFT_93727 [Hysterangium stoloniferum]|nr:hypothetical protein BU17DRAFT_93727 [Hysterangium stoloniferum]